VRLKTLNRRSDFDRLRRARKWVAKGFILQGAPRDTETEGGPARFGFVVSSKALKERGAEKRPGAVLRNRVKRRLKEATRLLAADHARLDHDYVLIARRESLHQGFTDLLEELKLAFDKVNRTPPAQLGRTGPDGRRRASAKDIQAQTEQI